MKNIILFILIYTSLISVDTLAAQGIAPTCNAGPFNLVIIEKNLGHLEKDAPTHHQVCKFMAVGGGLSGDPKKSGKAAPTCFNISGLVPNSTVSISFAGIPTNAIIGANLVRCYKHGEWVDKPSLEFRYENGYLSNTCQQIFGTNKDCTVTESTDRGHITYTLTMVDG